MKAFSASTWIYAASCFFHLLGSAAPAVRAGDDAGSDGSSHASIVQRASQDQPVVATRLVDDNGVFLFKYTVPVEIQGKTFNLMFDTGSSVLWTLSDRLPDGQFKGRTKYDVHPPVQICDTKPLNYGGGGTLVDIIPVTDGVDYAGINLGTYNFGAASSIRTFDTIWGNSAVEGIVGMDYGAGSWINAAKAKSELANVFTVDLPANSDGKVTFGSHAGIADSAITWIDELVAVQEGFGWVAFSSTDGDALFDTGVPGIMVSFDIASAYFRKLRRDARRTSASWWNVKCDRDLEDYDVGFEGQTFTIPGASLKGHEVGDGWCFCFLGVPPLGSSVSYIGLPFFHQFLVIFDTQQPRIGIARRK